ncbi:MAG: diguanylate cyclase, partial [Guyparkeria sp.]
RCRPWKGNHPSAADERLASARLKARRAVWHSCRGSLGYTVPEVERLSVRDWDSNFEPGELAEMLRSVRTGGDFFETRHRRKDGGDIDVEITTNAAEYKGEKLIFCNCRDITERKRDREEIKRLATTDALTGIANRGQFSRQLAAEIERARRFGRPLALIMYDLDHFKRVNDTFGHDVGDEVLTTTARLVGERVRQVDHHGRWGGEEFMVLLPETDLEAAQESAERLRSAIEAHSFPHGQHVTASFGVTVLGSGDRLETLVKRADEALYLAKRYGRNRSQALAPADFATS